MLAIRRAVNPSRSSNLFATITRAFLTSTNNITITTNTSLQTRDSKSSPKITLQNPSFHFPISRNLSSSTSQDSEDGFSDLDASVDQSKGSDVDQSKESDESDVDQSKGSESDEPLFKILLSATSKNATNTALDKWIKNGNTLTRDDVSTAMRQLRNRRLFIKALHFLEWVETNKLIEFTDRDYANHLDVIAKVNGLAKAEKYIDQIPESFKTEHVYEALMTNYVQANNLKKAEEILKKIKDLSLPLTIFAFNQLLVIYKRLNRGKIADLLLDMEKEGLKPNLFTYKLLLDLKGQTRDIEGMENILEMMKGEGVAPDNATLGVVTRHYIASGQTNKAENILKEIEGDGENRNALKPLLPLYASLKKYDEVDRIWKMLEDNNPNLEECLAAIEAYGQLGEISKAENVFETMIKNYKKVSARYYNVLLNVYANHKLLEKGKEFAKRMSNDGCKAGPLTWDALVKLYVKGGEVDKADLILQKVTEGNKERPMYNTYRSVLEEYARKGDVHNAEKVFYRLRGVEYRGKQLPYYLLLQAYVKSEKPAYGFRERMKGDNVYPTKSMVGQLGSVDPFGKSKKEGNGSIADLVD